MAKVPNGVETLPKISTGARTLQTTDGRRTAYSERERNVVYIEFRLRSQGRI